MFPTVCTPRYINVTHGTFTREILTTAGKKGGYTVGNMIYRGEHSIYCGGVLCVVNPVGTVGYTLQVPWVHMPWGTFVYTVGNISHI